MIFFARTLFLIPAIVVAALTFSAAAQGPAINAAHGWSGDDRVYVFRDDQNYVRYIGKSIKSFEVSGPNRITNGAWEGLLFYRDKIRAAFHFHDELDNLIYYFLSDGRILAYDVIKDKIVGAPELIDPDLDGGPRPPSWATHICAALRWTDDKVILFLDTGEYLRYDTTTGMDEGYPKPVNDQNWPGLGSYAKKIRAAVRLNDSTAYLFLDDDRYIEYNIEKDQAAPGGPQMIGDSNWKNLNRTAKPSQKAPPPSITIRGDNDKSGFDITLDFRFAGPYFDDPVRRQALQAAAANWERVITSDFEDIPAGTVFEIEHPGGTKEIWEVTLEESVDDLLVFVFAYDFGFGSGTKASAGNILGSRNEGKPFQPWAGRIRINTNHSRPWFFDPTPESGDDLPSATHHDFISTTSHELGHILGFLMGDYDATGNHGENDTFIGSSAVAFNRGKPVQLEKASSHIARSQTWHLTRPSIDENLMNGASVVSGYRFRPTKLDVSMLQDLGYSVDMDAISPVYDMRHLVHPLQAEELAALKKSPAGYDEAVSHWVLEKKEHVHSAIQGRPLKFMPGKEGTFRDSLREKDGGLELDRGSFFYVDHRLPANGGGEKVNNYTIVTEIKLPASGVEYSLYNVSPYNYGDASASIDKRGNIGKLDGCSHWVFANRWYRIALVVTAEKREYFVDGVMYHSQKSGGVDGSFSLNAAGGSGKPLLTLFAGKESADAPIITRSVSLYPRALTQSQIRMMGAAGESPGAKPMSMKSPVDLTEVPQPKAGAMLKANYIDNIVDSEWSYDQPGESFTNRFSFKSDWTVKMIVIDNPNYRSGDVEAGFRWKPVGPNQIELYRDEDTVTLTFTSDSTFETTSLLGKAIQGRRYGEPKARGNYTSDLAGMVMNYIYWKKDGETNSSNSVQVFAQFMADGTIKPYLGKDEQGLWDQMTWKIHATNVVRLSHAVSDKEIFVHLFPPRSYSGEVGDYKAYVAFGSEGRNVQEFFVPPWVK